MLALMGLAPVGVVSATTLNDLAPEVQQQLRRSPLAAPGVPVANFVWRVVMQRTARASKEVIELFHGATDGFSPVDVRDRRPEAEGDEPTSAGGSLMGALAGDGVRHRLSVRGLFRLESGTDHVPDVALEGLSLPPKVGQRFTIRMQQDGIQLNKQCQVESQVAASNYHAAIPGRAHAMVCAGQGRFQGMAVKSQTDLVWFDRLGVFLVVRERLDAGWLAYEEQAKIQQFELRPGS